MLNAARRGPASIAKSLLSPSRSSRCIKFIPTRSPLQVTTPSIRAISTTPRWTQRAMASPEVEVHETEEHGEAQPPPSGSQIDGQVTLFEELGTRNMVCKTVVDTITQEMGLKTMTQVQSLTINETLKGVDVLAQARTGTGKTLAFLIPVLQNIISVDPALEKQQGRHEAMSMDIRAIIISPTRELAEQIAREAERVTRNTGVVVQTAVGGTSKMQGLRKLRMEGCHILVGTPGRLSDLLSDPYSKVSAPKLSAFVLDEADRLLDDGFAPEISAIQKLLPRRQDVDRQTLLFSATVPREIMSIVRATTKPDFKFVRTVQEGEQQTHEKVPQKVITIKGLENYLPALVELCKRDMNRDDQPFKALVYFNATAEVSLAFSTLRSLRHAAADTSGQALSRQHPLYPLRIFEIHAKLSQGQRTWAADSFRNATHAVMLSSDVTARGMDFPNVTHVIQFGIPPTRDTYIHRIGRTARAGKGGEGWLFLTEMEVQMAKSRLRDLPLRPDQSLQAANVDMTRDASLPESLATILTQVVEATKLVPLEEKNAAYRATLGCFAWSNQKQVIVDRMNDRARYLWGMQTMPPLAKGLVSKLGFYQVTDLNLTSFNYEDSEQGAPNKFGRGVNRSVQLRYDDRDLRSEQFGLDGARNRDDPRDHHSRDGGASRSGGYGDRGVSRSGGYGDRGVSRSGGYGNRGASRMGGYGDQGASRYGGNRDRGAPSYGRYGRDQGAPRSGQYGNRGYGENGGYGREGGAGSYSPGD